MNDLYSPVFLLLFVFLLSVRSQVAVEAAKNLDKNDCWAQLAQMALEQGNHQVRVCVCVSAFAYLNVRARRCACACVCVERLLGAARTDSSRAGQPAGPCVCSRAYEYYVCVLWVCARVCAVGAAVRALQKAPLLFLATSQYRRDTKDRNGIDVAGSSPSVLCTQHKIHKPTDGDADRRTKNLR